MYIGVTFIEHTNEFIEAPAPYGFSKYLADVLHRQQQNKGKQYMIRNHYKMELLRLLLELAKHRCEANLFHESLRTAIVIVKALHYKKGELIEVTVDLFDRTTVRMSYAEFQEQETKPRAAALIESHVQYENALRLESGKPTPVDEEHAHRTITDFICNQVTLFEAKQKVSSQIRQAVASAQTGKFDSDQQATRGHKVEMGKLPLDVIYQWMDGATATS
jgi:hypothetical protein